MNKEIIATLTDENGETFTQSYTVEREFQVKGHSYLALIPKDDDLFDDVALTYEKLLEQ